MINRRAMLFSTAALVGAAGTRWALADAPPTFDAATAVIAPDASSGQFTFEIAERMTSLPCFGGKSLPLWTFAPGQAFPIVRLKYGQPFKATVRNALTRPGEDVTIHWHGLRIPNREDGVPYLTQAPISPGQIGAYSFTPPETGTFFFHTHCNSVEHFGRGLFGAMIVEGDETEPSDADLVLMMKDWRLDPDNQFLPFTSLEAAAKAGSYGTVRAINGVTKPVYQVPGSANMRVRFLNVDPSRISEIGVEGADAAIIAVDGNGCDPIPLGTWRMGPASRIDIVMRSPKSGSTARLMDYFSREPIVLAEFTSSGTARRTDTFTPVPLIRMPYKIADRSNAERIPFAFSSTATGQAIADLGTLMGNIPIGKLCLSKKSLWAINKQSWASTDHSDSGPALAALQLGKSYIFELHNQTPHSHPIHIHGHTFEVMGSSLRTAPPHRADTVLLRPKERLEVAIVADNPGKWMFHCHILEHQESGMMGYLSVS